MINGDSNAENPRMFYDCFIWRIYHSNYVLMLSMAVRIYDIIIPECACSGHRLRRHLSWGYGKLTSWRDGLRAGAINHGPVL